MRVITEAFLRDEFRAKEEPSSYFIAKGKILSPAAREYLHQKKIKIVTEAEGGKYCPLPERDKPQVSRREPQAQAVAQQAPSAAKGDYGRPSVYIDYESGAFYSEKPEHMTQLIGNKLVVKDHARIRFRGKLDSMQSLVVLNQVLISECCGNAKLMSDLDDVLKVLRDIMRCDVMGEPLVNESIIGYTHQELREMSHNPMKYFSVKQMVLPNYQLGKAYALLNQIRSAVREVEVAATRAYRIRNIYERLDIVETLNRLSSAVHIMMSKYLAGEYK